MIAHLLRPLLAYLNRPLCALSLHAESPAPLTFGQKLDGYMGLRCDHCGRFR